MQEVDAETLSQMSEIAEEELAPRTYRRGDVVLGEVVRQDDEGIVVSVGQKMEGMVLSQEMRLLDSAEREGLTPGQSVSVAILGGLGPDGMLLLSVDEALEEQRWEELQQRFADGATVMGRVTGQNRGGLVVDWQGIRGFAPFSQLAPVQGVDREEAVASRLDQEAEFNILELDRDGDRLIFSERAIWQRRRADAQARMLANLEEGQLLSGAVSSIRDFGAFVNLGDIDGLIPISELSWTMIGTPDEIVSVGETVEVAVLRVDQERQRLTLSLKRTKPEPWDTVHDRYRAGQLVEGTVTNIVPFGAFVRLEEGIEGLVHISELSQRRVENPRECVYSGQQISVLILNINSETHRMSLSYKQAFGL